MLWAECLSHLKESIPERVYLMWIRPLDVIVNDSEGRVQIYTPNLSWCNYIKTHYVDLIANTIEQVSEGRISAQHVEILVDATPGKLILQEDERPPATTVAALESNDVAQSIKKEKKSSLQAKLAKKRELNPSFTFSLFVEGRSNQMAAETCRKVVTQLGAPQHNPLFLYGSTGLGKTHLMQAVGNELLKNQPNAQVMYITTEDFMRGYITAINHNKMEEFKKIYRSLDLLLVDDVQLLTGEKSMTEFFYTFNALLDESKQIILTSDRYPKELTDLDARLVSRFSWGLSVEIEPPDIETRIEILLKKAETIGIVLPRNCALFIAQQVVANVRELEGALNKVVAMARFKGVAIDLELVRESLKDIVAIRARTINIENIQRVVSEYFRISMKDLIGPKRTRIYARPRQLAMSLARELTGDSFPEIGMAFGGRDHSTVMHACEKVQALRADDAAFEEDYKNLLKLLQS